MKSRQGGFQPRLQSHPHLLALGSADEKARTRQAMILIQKSQDVSSLAGSGVRILYPCEYGVRADALVEARHLLGGVLIEKM